MLSPTHLLLGLVSLVISGLVISSLLGSSGELNTGDDIGGLLAHVGDHALEGVQVNLDLSLWLVQGSLLGSQLGLILLKGDLLSGQDRGRTWQNVSAL